MLTCHSACSEPGRAAALPDTMEQFSRTYNMQTIGMGREGDESLTDTTLPTIATAATRYGRARMVVWVVVQLQQLADFCGYGSTVKKDMLYIHAGDIVRQWSGLRVTEYLLFLTKARCGHFGHFYDHFDPMRLGTWLGEYQKELQELRLHRQQELASRDKGQQPSAGISYETYVERCVGASAERRKAWIELKNSPQRGIMIYKPGKDSWVDIDKQGRYFSKHPDDLTPQ